MWISIYNHFNFWHLKLDTYNCIDDEEQKDFAFVEIYLSPGIDEDYKMKFCFPGNQYGVEKMYTETSYNPSQFRYNQLGRKTNLKADYTSSTFIENETINKGFNPAIQFKQFSNSGLSPLELFSSDTQMLVRFYSSDGRFPSKGFHAKYKTGKIYSLIRS